MNVICAILKALHACINIQATNITIKYIQVYQTGLQSGMTVTYITSGIVVKITFKSIAIGIRISHSSTALTLNKDLKK